MAGMSIEKLFRTGGMEVTIFTGYSVLGRPTALLSGGAVDVPCVKYSCATPCEFTPRIFRSILPLKRDSSKSTTDEVIAYPKSGA